MRRASGFLPRINPLPTVASEEVYRCQFKDKKGEIVYKGVCIGAPKVEYEALWNWIIEADFELRASCIALGHKKEICKIE